MTEQAMRFRIGVFVLAALLLLAVLVTLFGSSPTFFRGNLEYRVRFQDASGIAAGTPVRRSGVKVGEVKGLELDHGTRDVLVHLLVEQDHPIRQDEQVMLAQGILGGDATLDLVRREPGPAGAEPVPPGGEMPGARQPSVTTLVSQAADVVPTTQETLNEIRKSLQRFERLNPLLEETVREYRDLARATREMVPELRRTNQEVQELARAAREMVPELRRTNDEIAVTARNWGKLGERLDVLIQANQEKLVKAIENFNDMLVRISTTFNEENQRNLAATLKNVREGTESLESVARNTDEFVKESRAVMRRVNDSVTRADDVLANLQQTTRPLAERTASIMKNLDESAARLNLALGEVRDLVRGFGQAEGTLSRLLSDPSLYNNLNEAACQLTRILPRLDRVLKDVEVFADKIARHPESLGLGGIVNPSAGLKGPPVPAHLQMRAPGH